MTGFEYAFAGLLLSRGHIDDGLRVVRAVRDRFDGERRNPFNEFECGSNYARSMASYALIPILSGFTFDLPRGKLGFSPKIAGDFRAPFSLGGAWGEYARSANETRITVYEGDLTLKELSLPYLGAVEAVTIDGMPVAFTFLDGVLSFAQTTLKEIGIR
jgi:hypothetical protein